MKYSTLLVFSALLLITKSAYAVEQLPPTESTSAPAAAPQPQEELPEEPPAFSFGDFPFSLMFTVEQVQAMRTVLQAVETQMRAGTPAVAEGGAPSQNLEGVAATLVPQEPVSYPIYFLSSIAYRGEKDWAVWVGNQRITPKNNSGELEVTSVSDSTVSFRWKPTYVGTLIKRKNEDKLADTASIRNRLTVNDTVTLNTAENAISFMLRPNQSFSAAHLRTFEGKVVAAPLPALVAAPIIPVDSLAAPVADAAITANEAAVLNDMAGGAAVPESTSVDASTAATLQQLMKTQKNFESAVPKQ